MKAIVTYLLISISLCNAEDSKKYFLDYFRQFGYCAMCTLENSDGKSGSESTVNLKPKELFWGDPNKYDIGWKFKVSEMTPRYRNSTFLVVVKSTNKDPKNEATRSLFSIYPIDSESFAIDGLGPSNGKSIKWDDLISLLKEERSRIKALDCGASIKK